MEIDRINFLQSSLNSQPLWFTLYSVPAAANMSGVHLDGTAIASGRMPRFNKILSTPSLPCNAALIPGLGQVRCSEGRGSSGLTPDSRSRRTVDTCPDPAAIVKASDPNLFLPNRFFCYKVIINLNRSFYHRSGYPDLMHWKNCNFHFLTWRIVFNFYFK